MENLTTFERALLREFETLAAACERSGRLSTDTASRLRAASDHFSAQIATLRQRQTALEQRLSATTSALDTQTRQTTHLIEQVNRLLSKLSS